jgi:1,4-alpha-glucan branching enzyme
LTLKDKFKSNNMKKITISLANLCFAFLFSLSFSVTKAQQFKFHAEYEPSWYGPGFDMVQDIPGYVKTTLQATSADDQFVIEADNGYNRWKKNGLSLTTNINEVGFYEWSAGLTLSDNFLTTPATVNHYYTFRLKNVGYQSTQGVMMETNNAPVVFAANNPVSQNPAANAVSANSPVTVTFNLASAPSPQEKIFVRYTTDGFATSSVVQGVLTGGSGSTTGTVTIPGQIAGTVVSYYLLTTTFSLSNPQFIDADLATLNLANNQGTNYSYTVNGSSQTTANITFRVNMTGQVISPNGVKLAGSFNNFSTTATPMTNAGNNIYEATLPLVVGSQQIFKYVNGNEFELIDAVCGILGSQTVYDRFVNVPSTNTTLDLVCFNSCTNSCSTNPNTVNVTFRVNMTGQVISPNGVKLAGSFNNFSTTATPMTNAGNNIYEATLPLVVGSQQIFKYVNGSDFELIDASCGILGSQTVYDRFVNVPANNTTLDLVCFNSCTNSCSTNPNTVNVTFRVNMTGQVISPNGVKLAGSFNNFSTTATPMTNAGNNIYEATLPLVVGSQQIFKYVNGSDFELIDASCGILGSQTVYDRFVNVPANNTTLDLVCFNSCTNSCSATTNTVNVTFRVNMSQQTVSTDGVHIAGTFNGFSTTANEMTSLGAGIYETTIAIEQNTTVRYKFLNGTSFSVQENVPQTCGVDNGFGGFDRNLTVFAEPLILPTVCFGACSNCVIPNTVSLTFRVNMTQQTVSADGVHLAGSFNGFSSTATPMLAIGGGIYESQITIDENVTAQYVFINGNTFATQETVPAVCGVDNGFGGFNRSIVTPNANTILPTVCFSSCVNCIIPTTSNVTFRVNMSQQTVGTNGVHVSGSFNNWNPAVTPMTLTTNGVYEATVAITAGTTIQYKFINGNTFATQETVPSACGVANDVGGFDREITVGTTNETLPLVCFGECSNCIIPTTSNVTFRVNMSQQTVGTNGVHVSGSFNNWNPAGTPMTLTTNGVYEATVAITAGTTIQYKFINGNTFATQETVPSACGVANDVGGFDREITVGTTNETLPLVCFGECSNCIIPTTSNVTFRVNMSQQTVGTNGVHVSGSFNNWNPAGTPMTLTTNGVYEATVAITAGTIVQYKFINGNTFATQETVPSACGVANDVGGFDREITVGATNETLPIVCFGECSNCIIPGLSSVTFRVNMSLQTVNAAGVFLAGSFNSFSPTANAMTLVGNGIYEATVSIDTTLTIQYVFLNGNTFANQELVPISCGVDNGFGGFNRSFVVPEDNAILPTVCFGSCSNCVLPILAQVTFYVNMSEETISPSGVFLAGSFNNFNTTANPMTNVGGGVFKTDVNIDTTTIVQYKFVNGSTFESTPSICGVDDGFGGFNRQLTVPEATTFALPIVCFSSCENCVPNAVENVSANKVSFSPNPTNYMLYITNGETLKNIFVVDNLGKELFTITNNNSSITSIDLSSLANGIYFIKCSTDKETFTQKVIKQ